MDLWTVIKSVFTTGRSNDHDRLVTEFQDKIEYRFNDPELLITALTHRSFAKSGTGRWLPSNERLEFLGDSVLGLVVSDFLYRRFPRRPEGSLTKSKSILVNETSLHRTAQEIDLGRYIRLSVEEDKSGGRSRPSITSDTFEAVVGALFLDGGLAVVQSFIYRCLLSRIDEILSDKSFRNYKGELLELLQGTAHGMPRYEIVEEKGPDHDKTFIVAVYARDEEIGTGVGYSKKDAEQKAARAALRNLRQKN